MGGSSAGGVSVGGIGGASGAVSMGGNGAQGGGPAYLLYGAPLPFAPTATGFGLNVVLAAGAPADLRARVRTEDDEEAWSELFVPDVVAFDVAEWLIEDLDAGTEYEYQVLEAGSNSPLYAGRVVTQRPPGEAFGFAVVTDTHIAPRTVAAGDLSTVDFQEQTLFAVADNLGADAPDFIVNLGDMLDFHMFGFNVPPPDASWTRLGYLNYRRLFRDTLGAAPHFAVIGNWDGESGCDTEEEIERSRSQRLIYVPGPVPSTYPEGGSDLEDYYAFTWGDALFVVLNVMTYTETCHLLGTYPGVADDWTLGEAQLAWLEETLENATSKWRFVLIHHAVGGAAGDDINAAYGRGGGQAARVGEQAIVHDLMLEHDVRIFFYGHDHVFTDIVVDGIHYTLPGSAGAPWKFTTAETGYTQYWPDSGHGRVWVSESAVEVEFVSVEGEILYEFAVQ